MNLSIPDQPFPLTAAQRWWSEARILARSMRVRLAIGYVSLVSLVLIGSGLAFQLALTDSIEREARALLTERWGAVRGYLQLSDGRPLWVYESGDSVQAESVNRLRQHLLIADSNGNLLDISDRFPSPDLETRSALRSAAVLREPIFESRATSDGRYTIRRGPFPHGDTLLVLALAQPLEGIHQQTRLVLNWYFWSLPLLLGLLGWLAWHMAGRALLPLRQLAKAAEVVSSETLSLRISPRGARDEVDVLTIRFNEMLDRLERSFERIKRFTIDASHELRTPITAVRGQIEVALLTARTVEEYRTAMETAMEDVERLSKIVRSLLLLSQAESGQLALQTVFVDLSRSVREASALFDLPATAKSLNLSVATPEICMAHVDPIQFERLLMNLLSNAFKYTRPGDSISVSLSRFEGDVVLTVADTGPGIAEVHLPFIFDRFYRVRDDGGDVEKGIGLGLSFVQWIAQAHGGRVQVQSQVGQGTSFIVTLPAGDTSNPLRVLPIG
jgi:heavy metal sensor kinase